VIAPPTLSSDTICASKATVGFVVLFFDLDFNAVLQQQAEFIASLSQAIYDSLGNPEGLQLSIVLSPGSVYANVTVNDKNHIPTITEKANNGSIAVVYDGMQVAAKPAECPSGYVSPTGLVPCNICPANYFVCLVDIIALFSHRVQSNDFRTNCFACGGSSKSKPGSGSVAACCGL
jgi:hypothetical protein